MRAEPVPGDASPGTGRTEREEPPAPGPLRPGIDALVRGEAASGFDLGTFTFAPGRREERILWRLRPSLAATPSRAFAARAEGQWYGLRGDADLSTIGLYQGYVEGAVPGTRRVVLKAGRQELVYGSAFLIGADTFYDGLSFDAAKAVIRPADNVSVDLLGGRYVKKWAAGMVGTLYGIYATWTPRAGVSADLYGFRDTGGAGLIHVGGAHEVTYSFGTRIAANAGRHFAVELEPVWQFGRKSRGGAAHDDIRAYGGHADLSFDPVADRHGGTLLLSYAYGSGDGNPGDGRFTEFHNPNNDTTLVGDTGVVGDLSGLSVAGAAASGVHAVTAGGRAGLAGKLGVSASAHYFRADKTPAGIRKDIGVEANLAVSYAIREETALVLSVNRFFTGGFFRDAAGSGADIGYFYFQVTADL